MAGEGDDGDTKTAKSLELSLRMLTLAPDEFLIERPASLLDCWLTA